MTISRNLIAKRFLPLILGIMFLSASQISQCEEDFLQSAMEWTANKKYDKAVASIDRGLAAHPGDGELMLNRGAILQLMGRYEEALRDEDKAISWYKNKPDKDSFLATAYANRAAILDKMNKKSKALDSYKYALKAKPNDAHANEYFAVMLANRGQRKEALKHLKLAQDRDLEIHDDTGAARVADRIRKVEGGATMLGD